MNLIRILLYILDINTLLYTPQVFSLSHLLGYFYVDFRYGENINFDLVKCISFLL